MYSDYKKVIEEISLPLELKQFEDEFTRRAHAAGHSDSDIKEWLSSPATFVCWGIRKNNICYSIRYSSPGPISIR